MYALLRDLLAAGVPVDGVGLQFHVRAGRHPPPAAVAANVARLADLGLAVEISEMDVGARGLLGRRLGAQRIAYRDVLDACLSTDRVDAVTVWGVSDAVSWRRREAPLLLDARYRRKPAYFAVRACLRARARPVLAGTG